jgi:ketosteroid isomerase-like protein
VENLFSSGLGPCVIGEKPEWTTDKVVVAASGDMAYATGTDHIIFRAGKQVVSTNNNGLVVWKKQRDGLWKAVVDIATPAAPTVPPKK